MTNEKRLRWVQRWMVMGMAKIKQQLIYGIQFFILIYTMVLGFWHTYLWIWYVCRLPIEWWSLGITLLVAMLSGFGLYQWIKRTDGERREGE